MCVSLSMNTSCCASVLPSTHDYAYRACDTSITASRGGGGGGGGGGDSGSDVVAI